MVLPSERTGPSINTDFRAASLIHGRAAASAEIISLDLGTGLRMHGSDKISKVGRHRGETDVKSGDELPGCTFLLLKRLGDNRVVLVTQQQSGICYMFHSLSISQCFLTLSLLNAAPEKNTTKKKMV